DAGAEDAAVRNREEEIAVLEADAVRLRQHAGAVVGCRCAAARKLKGAVVDIDCDDVDDRVLIARDRNLLGPRKGTERGNCTGCVDGGSVSGPCLVREIVDDQSAAITGLSGGRKIVLCETGLPAPQLRRGAGRTIGLTDRLGRAIDKATRALLRVR